MREKGQNQRKRRNWIEMDDNELVGYSKQHGLYKLKPKALQKKDQGYYNILLRRGVLYKVCTTTIRNWSNMSNEELIEYGRNYGLFGISPRKASAKNTSYYKIIRKRGLAEKVFVRTYRNWSNMSNEELMEYGKEHGLTGLSPKVLENKNHPYYYILLKRGLVNDVCTKTIRNWSSMNEDELIKYAKQKGLFGVNPLEAYKRDKRYYQAIKRTSVAKKVFVRMRRDWSSMNDDELMDYGKDHGLFGVGILEAEKKDQSYYRAIKNRDLVDKVFVRKQFTQKDVIKFLQENQSATAIASLTAINGYASEVAQILTQEWPNRFPSYDELMKRLPQIVPKIAGALQPISLRGGNFNLENMFAFEFSPQTKRDLGEILYQIGVQEYQLPFNSAPRKTLNKLEQRINETINKELQHLYQRIYKFYRDVFTFNIPGYGRLATR